MGDITYNASTTVWPSLDAYGRYIWNCTNFTLPENVTMIPPEKNNGLYIYCTGTCTINGTIDMRNQRLVMDSSNGISNFVIINGTKYLLAKGGNTVKGGNGGAAGEITPPIEVNSINSSNNYAAYRVLGGQALETTNAGNINGGGTSSYGLAATSFNDGQEFTYGFYGLGYHGNHSYSLAKKGEVKYNVNAPGALILISKTLNIGVNGVLNCVANEGVKAESGTNGQAINAWYDDGAYCHTTAHGKAGNGAMAPSGGGPVTIITENLSNNGKILTHGGCLISNDMTNGSTAIGAIGDYRALALGGDAGEGGIFISEAGEIKAYVVGGI